MASDSGLADDGGSALTVRKSSPIIKILALAGAVFVGSLLWCWWLPLRRSAR